MSSRIAGRILVVAGLALISVGIGLWLGASAATIAAGLSAVLVGEGLDPSGRGR